MRRRVHGAAISDGRHGGAALSVTWNGGGRLTVTAGRRFNGDVSGLGGGRLRRSPPTPAANQYGGPVTITVTVSDGTTTTNETFDVTVTAVNDAPAITALADQTIAEDGTTGALPFTVSDVETAAGA